MNTALTTRLESNQLIIHLVKMSNLPCDYCLMSKEFTNYFYNYQYNFC